MKLNGNFNNIQENYLFQEINEKVNGFKLKNPKAKIISLGIGDVTRPIPLSCVFAMIKASLKQGFKRTFHGYQPYNGNESLINAIVKEYKSYGVHLNNKEVYITSGAKDCLAQLLNLFDRENKVAVINPSYPVYSDGNAIFGREVKYVSANGDNNFMPKPKSDLKADIIYLCSPDNPTGTCYDKETIKSWVDFAIKNNSVIIFDSAYRDYSNGKIKTVYNIENADKCCIEVCSFSKNVGFTGIRCGYVVIPEKLREITDIYNRYIATCSNGVSYISQMGALASFKNSAKRQIKRNVAYYKKNAKIIKETMQKLKITCYGGENSPYIFIKCPNRFTSWEFFDKLLMQANIVVTPAVGFGSGGENYVRLSAFSTRKNTVTAMRNFEKLF